MKNTITKVLSVMISAFMCLVICALMIGGCTHPRESTARGGQCLLDNGVLSEVLAALAEPDYLKQVGMVALNRAGSLVDCALQAIAAQSSGTEAAPSGAQAAVAGQPEGSSLARRAREVLASRRTTGG